MLAASHGTGRQSNPMIPWPCSQQTQQREGIRRWQVEDGKWKKVAGAKPALQLACRRQGA
jgi:hypothetical protein